jgi:TetR/AcrR family transcriptional regulator, mexJK operon transcriptional repressor
MSECLSNDKPRATGGRPTKEETPQRREQLLVEATRVFLNYGYGLSSIDVLAREAHVAKRTIYQHFGSKAELFGAVIRRLSDRIFEPFPNLTADLRTPEQVLTDFAQQLLMQVTSSEVIGVHRVVIGEAHRFPELAQQFYQNGPARALAVLERYLEAQNQLGVLHIADVTLAAEQFLNLVLGECHRRILFGIDQSASVEAMKHQVAGAIALFLRGHQ